MSEKQALPDDLVFKPKGVLEDEKGRIRGMWMKGRKGRKVPILLEKPIRRPDRPFRIERRTITINGRTYENYPVKVFSEVNSLNHWNKYNKR